jgi:hypothetical protein
LLNKGDELSTKLHDDLNNVDLIDLEAMNDTVQVQQSADTVQDAVDYGCDKLLFTYNPSNHEFKEPCSFGLLYESESSENDFYI